MVVPRWPTCSTIQQRRVQVRQRNVPHIARAVEQRVQRHLVRRAPRTQVRLREQAQRHASRVGREQREVCDTLHEQLATRRRLLSCGQGNSRASCTCAARQRGQRTVAAISVAPIGSGAPCSGAPCTEGQAGCPDCCARLLLRLVASSAGSLVAGGSGAATDAVTARVPCLMPLLWCRRLRAAGALPERRYVLITWTLLKTTSAPRNLQCLSCKGLKHLLARTMPCCW